MKLNHLDLDVPDVQATAAFFVDHFGFSRSSNATSPALAILTDEAGLVLVLQRREAGDDSGALGHVGFYVDTVEEVHAHHTRIPGAGEVQSNGRGTMFYVRAPGGVLIEVNCRR